MNKTVIDTWIATQRVMCVVKINSILSFSHYIQALNRLNVRYVTDGACRLSAVTLRYHYGRVAKSSGERKEASNGRIFKGDAFFHEMYITRTSCTVAIFIVKL